MKKIYFFLAILALGFIQLTLLNYFRIFTVRPDLLLVACVVFSLRFPGKWALFLSVFAGLFKDISSAQAIGINTLLFALWSLAITRLTREISIDNDYLAAILVLVIALTQNILCGFYQLYVGNSIALGIFLRITVLESLYTAACLPLVIRALRPLYT